MDVNHHIFHYEGTFELESGESLPGFQLKYSTLGRLNPERDNVIWVCHALTGSSNVRDWWADLFTGDGPFDPANHFIICANMLGSCYGSTGPLTINPATGVPFYHDFPAITNGDIVRAFDLLRVSLRISNIQALLGGSLGGQQVLEWAIRQPEVFRHVIPMACNASHSPWGIAFNESQRMAIEADQTWKTDDPRAGINGLRAARAIGMISYRHYQTFQKTQAEKQSGTTDNFRAATYQRHQGNKLASRFNAYSYWTLSKAMDSHDVGRGRHGTETALRTIRAKTLVVGIDSDILFPVEEQQYLADTIPGAQLAIVPSLYGHDGFLVECEHLRKIISHFFETSRKGILV